jgi:hypothetical protein
MTTHRSLRLCILTLLTCALLLPPMACTSFAISNVTAPLGTGQVGSRDDISVTIFNRTPYRAIFTIGMYNTWDQNTVPTYFQFADGQNGSEVLEGNTTVGPQTFQCNRTLGIGSFQLIQAVLKSEPEQNSEAALIEGVAFSAAPIDDPLGVLPTEGTAAPVNIFQGAEFPCNAEIWIFFEEDASAPGGFRIAFEVVTPP